MWRIWCKFIVRALTEGISISAKLDSTKGNVEIKISKNFSPTKLAMREFGQ
jgi:hypothetical protein